MQRYPPPGDLRALLDAGFSRTRPERVRTRGWPIVQTAVAAAVSWLVAAKLLGHPTPFFAPVAAIMALGATRGQRLRRAVEMMVGVTLGVGLGDLLVHMIGTGVLQLAFVVLLAMFAAVLLGAGVILLTEAGVSGALVATLAPASYGFPSPRLIDTLCGGVVALIFSQLLFPIHPIRVIRDAATSTLEEFAATLDQVAGALETRDLDAAEQALARSRELSSYWSSFDQALDVGRETVRYAPRRRRYRARVASYREAGLPLDLLVTDLRVLARAAVRALLIDDPIPAPAIRSLYELAAAARQMPQCVGRPSRGARVRSDALRAARRATRAASEEDNLSLSLLAAYSQATAADILRTLGLDRGPAHELVGRAATGAEPWELLAAGETR